MKNFSSYLKELELPLNDDFKEPQKLFKKPSKSLEVLKEITQTFPVLDNTLYEFSVKDHHSLFLNRIGVVFSGGQASGGHNVIYGLWEALKKANPNVELVGFLDGPSGIIENRFKFLDDETMANFKNTGGFDLLGSGRTKIETLEQKSCAVSVFKKSARLFTSSFPVQAPV